MSEPVYVGMPPTDRSFNIEPWGRIRCGGVCKDDYVRIITDSDGRKVPVKLQVAALRSFQDAEKQLGFKIPTTGSWRACSRQVALYATDNSRYAPPNITAHCRGLAIDVSTTWRYLRPIRWRRIRRALAERGWHQSRPVDEPWHHSFGIQC